MLLMDLLMPEMVGVEAIEQNMVFSPATHIIVLTSYSEDEYLFPAMRAGIQGYLLKDVEPEDLVNAIRAAALYALKRRLVSIEDPEIAED